MAFYIFGCRDINGATKLYFMHFSCVVIYTVLHVLLFLKKKI